MPGTLIVGAEGILLNPKGEGSYASNPPISEGIELVMQLHHHPTSRTIIIANTTDTDGAEYFCKINGLAKVGVVSTAIEDQHEEPATAQWAALQRLRSRGPINLVLTAYKEVYERCSISHQPVLLFGRRGHIGSLDSLVPWEDLHARVIRSRDAAMEELNGPDEEDD